MNSKATSSVQNAISQWVGWVCRHAKATVLLSFIATIALFYITITEIGISTDTSDMLSPDLLFRQNSIALSEAFPQFSDNIVIVIDGGNADLVNQAADQVNAQLRSEPNLFGEVFDPADLDFFQRNGLLYLETDELVDMADRLIAAQPFLGTLWIKPTLPGLLDLLSLFLKEGKSNQELLGDARPMISNITDIILAQASGKPDQLSWRTIISGNSAENSTRIIVVQPKTDFGSLHPGAEAIKRLREIGLELKLKQKFDVRLRLTGSVPLAEEELESVVDGLGLAGILSLSLVLVLLFWGLKSLRLVLATLITLIFGLVWTAGFATLAVGTLNLISVAFAVLFIGLSVDFGIHFALRYRESSDAPISALAKAAERVGGALSLSAVAAAIGFFSFLPTDYIGLAELGLIAGGGMFIALFANLTLLPALISLMPPKPLQLRVSAGKLSRAPGHWPVIGVAAVLAVLSLFVAPKVIFDFDPLNLKDTNTESVATFFDLMAKGKGNPYSITVLAKDLATADQLAARAKKLTEVDSVVTLSSMVPAEQDDKLAIIDNLALILGPSLTGSAKAIQSSETEQLKAAVSLQNEIRAFRRATGKSDLLDAVSNLGTALNRLLTSSNPDHALAELEHRLLASLPHQMSRLKKSLNAAATTLKDIPKELHSRQITADGRAKVEIKPRGNMRNRQELAAFVEAVRQIAPAATGTPVVILEAGDTVIQAFIEAAAITFVLIIILVLALTRSLREIALIFTPLLLAALFILAASVLLSLPFNFANVIVLPLLFGLGIAGSIHLVLRDRDQDSQNVMATSTPRAVVFSALTTIGSFGSIALSSHPGTSSMGVLLTIAISLSLICTLIVLPALLTAWPKAGAK
ncbi:MAG: MMPL family transporter [Rhodospirillaceae bacterium]|nr:MMPL family transporter [Rhodospirillaceae bacterium]